MIDKIEGWHNCRFRLIGFKKIESLEEFYGFELSIILPEISKLALHYHLSD